LLYGKDELVDHDQARLKAVKIELDQCWDLLRQQEARREFDQDPNDAKVRRPSVVERYSNSSALPLHSECWGNAPALYWSRHPCIATRCCSPSA
jgi:hypothetical protein